jgi:hypothetical protein
LQFEELNMVAPAQSSGLVYPHPLAEFIEQNHPATIRVKPVELVAKLVFAQIHAEINGKLRELAKLQPVVSISITTVKHIPECTKVNNAAK